MQLTDQQIRHFRTFGYLKLPAVFSPTEMVWITEEFETAIQVYARGMEHDGSTRTMFGGPIERTESCVSCSTNRGS